MHPLDTPYKIRDFKKTHINRTAIICCSRDGEASLLSALMSAKRQCDVYLYDDASQDATSEIGIKLGIPTVSGEANIGKARGIRRMLDMKFQSIGNRRIPEVYDFIMILDDDTILSKDYVRNMVKKFDENHDVAVLEGRLISSWKPVQSSNGFIAARSFTSWAVHLLLTWVQSVLKARTWINGAIAVYRADILDSVVRNDPKFITEDNDWCWQIHRAKTGRIKFEYSYTARLQEPQNFKELYLQHLRWNWGMFQVAKEHKTGLRFTRPDMMWLFTMILAAHYICWPIVTLLLASYTVASVKVALLWFIGRYVIYACIGAIVSRQWQHIFMWPYFIAYDFNWRLSVIHGLVKTIRMPVLDNVVWESPTRHADTSEEAYAA